MFDDGRLVVASCPSGEEVVVMRLSFGCACLASPLLRLYLKFGRAGSVSYSYRSLHHLT